MTARLCLDLNVLFAELKSRATRVRPSAAAELVGWVDAGTSPAGPVQLVVSIPMLEAWQDVLIRHFGMSRDEAATVVAALETSSMLGPLGDPPHLVVGAGHVPFATEAQMVAEIRRLQRPGDLTDPAKLFGEIEDDRHVRLTALAGQADLLVTDNLKDFRRGHIEEIGRPDVFILRNAFHDVAVGSTRFAARWLREGVVPNAATLRAKPDLFPPTSDADSTPD